MPERYVFECAQISSELRESLKKYYGRLPLSDIVFFKSDDEKISVFIMEPAQTANSAKNIDKIITEIMLIYSKPARMSRKKLTR